MLVIAVVVAALAVELVVSAREDTQRRDRIDAAKRGLANSVDERVLFLHGIADMIGVRDEARPGETSRFARSQARFDPAVLAVQWLRRGPGGTLARSGRSHPRPVLIPAPPRLDDSLAHAGEQPQAQAAIRSAAIDDRVAASPPVSLGDGRSAVYVAVPVDPGKLGGSIARIETQSVVVGLLDTQVIATDAIGAGPAVSVADTSGELATVGGAPENPASATINVHGHRWTIGVERAARSPLERALPWLILFAGLAFTAIVTVLLGRAIRRRDEALSAAHERAAELERRSREDELTGASNRTHFSERLAQELARGGEGVAVLLADLDEFKRVNDEHGHLAGDRALRIAARRLAQALRGSELLARWGGEEFAVLVPRIGRADAIALAERLRAAMAARPFDLGAAAVELTLSVGVALTADGLRTPDELVGAADEALYAAKSAGRNAVRGWRPPDRAATGSPLP